MNGLVKQSSMTFLSEEIRADYVTAGISEVFSLLYFCCIPCCCCATVPGSGPFFLIAFNALGGTIFAAIAVSMGE